MASFQDVEKSESERGCLEGAWSERGCLEFLLEVRYMLLGYFIIFPINQVD